MLPTTIKVKVENSKGFKNLALYIHPDDVKDFEKDFNFEQFFDKTKKLILK